jgi:hypothetical protein
MAHYLVSAEPKTGQWVWEELDYCSPPLKQEREQVLDTYFDLEEIEPVSKEEGWQSISALPRALPEA